MNKIFIVLAVLALFNAHIARGNGMKGGKSAAPNPSSAPQADQAATAAPAAPATPEKPETCTATHKGAQETFQPGDRYCASESTYRVCNYGDWIDGDCPAKSKCMEGGKQVLCREMRRNAPWPTGPSGAQNSEPQSNQPAQPAQSSNSQAKPSSDSQPSAPQPSAPQPSAPQPSAPQSSAPQPSAPQPSNPQPQPAAPQGQDTGSKDCPGGLKEGDQICSGETSYKMCHDGNMMDEPCPSPAKCVSATDSKRVLCREIRRNPPQQEKPESHRRR